ncbi:hypothetical protein TRIUR3_32404 [Triticum urartu]|uniref:RRM domain-containing protein n=1 Tax=Triticum urartu TaxID=4572 RepID=M7ZN23_TRIUA|nr:hypothetical protein TRIUR3_32404 [Triticum urartu]
MVQQARRAVGVAGSAGSGRGGQGQGRGLGEMRTRGATATASAANTEAILPVHSKWNGVPSFVQKVEAFRWFFCNEGFNANHIAFPFSGCPFTGYPPSSLPERKEQRIREVKQPEEPENTTPVLCTGHIPHGFYKDQMQGFFQELGAIKKRVSIARNHKTGKSKHSDR